MKKRTLSILAFSAVFAFATLTSCGGESHEAEESHEETTEEVVAEETTDEVAEGTVAEEAAGDAEAGLELFASSGCVACHQVDTKTVGPSLKDIAAGYADNDAGLTAFLAGEGEAIIDPEQAAVMAPQVETTKNMSEDDRSAITAYVMSNK